MRETPTAAVLAAAAVTGRVRVTVGAGDAGSPGAEPSVPWADLARPERLADLIDRTAAWCGGAPGPSARTAAASLMIGDLASALAAPIAGALVAARRALAPGAGLHVRFGWHGVEELVLADPALGVLPDDVLAGTDDPENTGGTAGIRTLQDLATVRRMAATSFAELVRPVADTLCAIDRRGRRGVWGEVGEALAGAVFLAARAVGRPHEAPEEVSRLRALAPPDVGQPVGWVDVPHAGGAVPWKRRTVCCLAYQTPRWAGEYCATCPLIPREETARRIGDWLRGGR